MPQAARGSGVDTVNTNHGCDSTTVTDECSTNVFYNNIGAVRKEDHVQVHLVGGGGDFCVPHAPPLDGNYSPNVFVNGRNAAYLGSTYEGEDISSGASNVWIN
jgi:uncharacterized Zn-binding protein involved in type VI secretion